MAKARPSVQKRNKEARAIEKKLDKAARAAARESAKAERPEVDGAGDPDLVGIVPGPQPSPWGDDAL